jgi:deoxyribose-phosphate aldolase
MPGSTDRGVSDAYDKRGRRQLSLAQLAGHLDHRLHLEPIDRKSLSEGCRVAAPLGFAAVTCRPDQVPQAAALLRHTEVAVVSAIGWQQPSTWVPTEQEMFDEGLGLVELGASELGIIINATRLGTTANVDNGGVFLSALIAMIARQEEYGYRIRVHLEPCGLTHETVRDVCRVLADTGVWMVQAGSWQGPRASYRHLLPMREALGCRPLLKWTTPISSFHVMLLAMGDGVDRFNAEDAPGLLAEAQHQAQLAPLAIPLAGIDY